LMHTVLGANASSRLFMNLREEKGYTYGASSGMSAPYFRGTWSASTSVRTEVTEPALTDLIAEITTLRDVPVPVDVVDVFRRPVYVPEVVEDAIAIGAPVLWLQQGVIHPQAAARAQAAGLAVVMDRCIKVEHAYRG